MNEKIQEPKGETANEEEGNGKDKIKEKNKEVESKKRK